MRNDRLLGFALLLCFMVLLSLLAACSQEVIPSSEEGVVVAEERFALKATEGFDLTDEAELKVFVSSYKVRDEELKQLVETAKVLKAEEEVRLRSELGSQQLFGLAYCTRRVKVNRGLFSPYKFYTSHTVNCNTFVDSLGIWAEIYNFRYRKSGSKQAVINYSLNSYDYFERSHTSPYSKSFCGTGGGGLYYRGRYYPMTTLFGCASFKIFT